MLCFHDSGSLQYIWSCRDFVSKRHRQSLFLQHFLNVQYNSQLIRFSVSDEIELRNYVSQTSNTVLHNVLTNLPHTIKHKLSPHGSIQLNKLEVIKNIGFKCVHLNLSSITIYIHQSKLIVFVILPC